MSTGKTKARLYLPRQDTTEIWARLVVLGLKKDGSMNRNDKT